MCISIGLVKPLLGSKPVCGAVMPRLRLKFKVVILIEEGRFWYARGRRCVDICASPWLMLSLNSPPGPSPEFVYSALGMKVGGKQMGIHELWK